VAESDNGYRPGDLLDKAAYDSNGVYLGQIEAVAWGRNRVIRRIGIKFDSQGDALTFVTIAGVRVHGDRVMIGGDLRRSELRVLRNASD
jgi:hypothetical protein